MTLTSRLQVSHNALYTSTAGVAPLNVPLDQTYSAAHDNGTGVGKVDKVYSATRTLAASATEDLDLAGVLLDAQGSAITFARIKSISVRAAAGNTNNVLVGAAASAPWITLLNSTGTITLRPGAFFAAGCSVLDAVGYAVTATTADLLKVANSSSGTSVSYDIVIVGCSV